MHRSAVGSRLPILPILITAFRAVVEGRQFQAFIPAMSEEMTISMIFILFPCPPFFITVAPIFFLFKPLLVFSLLPELILFFLTLLFIQ